MNRQTTAQDHAAWPAALLAWVRGRLTACAHGVMLGALALAEALVAVLAALAIAVPIPGVGLAVRQLAELTRRDGPAAWIDPVSNAAIGARLVITERAVAKHTASIFLKLRLQPSEEDNRRVRAVLAYLGG